MKVVVDTNILFSACITPSGKNADLLLNPQYQLEKLASHFIIIELFKYQEKMIKLSKLNKEDFLEVLYVFVRSIDFINEDQIPAEVWKQAEKLLIDIDPKDVAHLALSLHTDAYLWTGDKALLKGETKYG